MPINSPAPEPSRATRVLTNLKPHRETVWFLVGELTGAALVLLAMVFGR